MQRADPDVMPVVCPYFDCPSHEQATASHVVSFGAFAREDGQAVQRRRCGCCRRTFSGHTGTMFARMRTPHSLVAHALELSAEGVSKAAIGRSLDFAASTIARWVKLAGQHTETFHEVRVRPQDVGEIQMDELRCRGSGDAAAAWAYGAIEVFARLWVGLLISRRTLRNTRKFVRKVKNALVDTHQCAIVTSDGMKYYEPAMRRVFRTYPVVYQQVDNSYRGGKVIRSEPRLVFGSRFAFEDAFERTDSKKPNTSYIERLNLVQRTCCAMLRRRTSTPARSIESLSSSLQIVRAVYNWVRPHSSLRTRSGPETPAMAAGLVARPLTLLEILAWRPPSWWWREKRLREAFPE